MTRRALRWLSLLALSLVLGLSVAVIARGDRFDLKDIGATLTSVRDSSLDAALLGRVRSALALSRRVSGLRFELDARSGVVTLSGRVPTREARSIIEAIVGDTPGVLEVHNRLQVDASVAAGYERTLLQRIADLETEVAVQERLRLEPRLVHSGLRVSVERGVTVLRGEVESDAERAEAQRIVQAAVGADQVRNELRSLGLSASGEDRLARLVEFELYTAGAFDLVRIQVTSMGGRVTLHGDVRTPAERLLAERVAQDVPGVIEVVNELTLERAS
ncbi:MAG: BON domain-containing protein [Vicinamibacteria bacterium]